MVVQGNFSVQLVEAITKQPFPEHKAEDGTEEIYAEVEPGAEYFIQTKVIGGQNDVNYYIEYVVDGTKLNYYSMLSQVGRKMTDGLYSAKDGIRTMRALRFAKPTISPRSLADATNTLKGKIIVTIYEGIFVGMKQRERHHSSISIDPGSVSASATGGNTKKIIRSGEGDKCDTLPSDTSYRHYSPGKHLQTITINYCTVVGLIEAKILPQPPNPWDLARSQRPWNNGRITTRSQMKYIEPKRVKRDGHRSEDGKLLSQPDEYDLFDLTALSESEDED